jgi:hypothetical protein
MPEEPTPSPEEFARTLWQTARLAGLAEVLVPAS